MPNIENAGFTKVTIFEVLESEEISIIWYSWSVYFAKSEFHIFWIWIQTKFDEIKEELNGLFFKVRLRGVVRK
jgi:hypothetical protein